MEIGSSIIVSSQRATGRVLFVVPSGADVSAINGVTDKVVLIEHKDGVSTIETAGDNLGNQATSVLCWNLVSMDPWLGKQPGISLSGCVIVTGDSNERLVVVENVKVEGTSERSGRDDFRGKH